MNVGSTVRRKLRRLSSAGCAISTLVLATLVPPGAAAARNDFTAIGRLDRAPADAVKAFGKDGKKIVTANETNGTIVAIPEARQLWQFWLYTIPGESGTAIAVRDLDTMRIVRTMRVDLKLRRGTANAGGDWMHAVDVDGAVKRLFLVANSDDPIIEFDLRTFAERRIPLGPTAPKNGLGALEYDRYDDDLIAVWGLPPNSGVYNGTFAYRVDLTSGAVAGPRTLRSCTGPLPSSDIDAKVAQFQVVVAPQYVYVPCTRAGNIAAVVKVSRKDLTNQTSVEQMALGPISPAAAFADQAIGRLHIATVKGEIYPFDTATMSFLGTLAAHTGLGQSFDMSYGIDRDTGRVFFLSPTLGLGVVEGRYFPVPQPRTQRNLRDNAQQRIYSDARTNRLFVLPSVTLTEFPPAYTVYRVDAAPVPPADPDPDASTVDRDEKPGVTESSYNAQVNGYGVRVLLARGAQTIVPMVSGLGGSPPANILTNNISSKCGFTDRELYAARVSKSQVDPGQAVVEAIALDVDGETKQDLDTPSSRCDVTGRNASGTTVFTGIFSTGPGPEFAKVVDNPNSQKDPRWKYEPARCVSPTDEGGGSEGRGDDNGSQPLGTSEVKCPVPGRGAHITAEATSSLGQGGVTVGYARTKTDVYTDKDGLHVDAEAVAGDITIGGTIRIGEVKSVAKSVSNGRPRKESASTHTVTISEVYVGSQRLCAAVCNQAVVDALNQLGNGRFEFRAGGAGCVDTDLLKGTPRGALTSVGKSAERQASDQASIGDFTNECPGLEMLWFNDTREWGRARQLYQFAGVATEAGYRIVDVLSGVPFPDIQLPDDVPVPTVDRPVVTEPRAVVTATPPAITGNPIQRVVQAIGRGLRLVWTNPREALVLLTAWLLFAQPVLLERRRRRLRQVWAS